MYIHVAFESPYGVLVSRVDLHGVNTARNRVQTVTVPFFSFDGGLELQAR